jgi:peptidyl-prolyl cis-trans isomerase C
MNTPAPTLEPLPTTTEATQIPPEPTQTSEPLAAMINGEAITMAEFQAELARYQLVVTTQTKPVEETPPEETVLNEMIATILLSQGAVDNGFTLSAEELQSRLDDLTNKMGGQEPLNTWLSTNQYTLDEFKKSYQLGILSAWMRDKITSEVPAMADQVHARQILLLAESDAQSVLQQVRSGVDFATIAEQYDPITKGDLGWFPRGYLVQPLVEEAAFTLQPGGVSEVIHTDAGYHIIQVIERDEQHSLTPDAYATLQHIVLKQWLEDRIQSSQIETYIQ